MISNRDVRSALRGILIDAIDIGSVNISKTKIAWENRSFKDLDDYLIKERLFPIDDKISSNETDGGMGVYELTLYVSKGKSTETAETLCAEICNVYQVGVGNTYNNADVVIDESRVEITLEEENYWYFPIRIDYRKFNIN